MGGSAPASTSTRDLVPESVAVLILAGESPSDPALDCLATASPGLAPFWRVGGGLDSGVSLNGSIIYGRRPAEYVLIMATCEPLEFSSIKSV